MKPTRTIHVSKAGYCGGSFAYNKITLPDTSALELPAKPEMTRAEPVKSQVAGLRPIPELPKKAMRAVL